MVKVKLLLKAEDIYIFHLLYVVLQDLSFLSLWHCCIFAKVSFFTGLQSSSVESVWFANTRLWHLLDFSPSVLNSFCTDPFGCLLFILCQYFLLISRNKIYFCIIESIHSAVFILTSHLEASRSVDGLWKRVNFGIDDVIPTESKWTKKAAFRSGEGESLNGRYRRKRYCSSDGRRPARDHWVKSVLPQVGCCGSLPPSTQTL